MAEAKPKTTMEDPANDYLPVFMDEGSVWILIPGGVTDPVASVPQCLTWASAGELITALMALGYSDIMLFPSEPFHGGTTDFNKLVPWLQITTGGSPAFVVNAGKYANYWNHGVHPFVGSSYEKDLRDDISNRAEASQNGQSDIG